MAQALHTGIEGSTAIVVEPRRRKPPRRKAAKRHADAVGCGCVNCTGKSGKALRAWPRYYVGVGTAPAFDASGRLARGVSFECYLERAEIDPEIAQHFADEQARGQGRRGSVIVQGGG